MKFILGKKIEMTQVWVGEDKKAVTKVAVGPCVVTQIKTKDGDGYEAVQLGFGDKKAKNLSKSVLGHLGDLGACRWLREFRPTVGEALPADLIVGDKIDASTFQAGDMVKVVGTSKGRGFAGVVKRHGFHGQDKTHGNKDQLRMPGSIGAGGVQRVFKGVRMPGHMRDARITVANLPIIEVDEANNVLLIEGGIPGARGSLVLITAPGELTKAVAKVVSEPIKIEEKTEATINEPSAETKEEIKTEDNNEEVKPEVAQTEVASNN